MKTQTAEKDCCGIVMGVIIEYINNKDKHNKYNTQLL